METLILRRWCWRHWDADVVEALMWRFLCSLLLSDCSLPKFQFPLLYPLWISTVSPPCSSCSFLFHKSFLKFLPEVAFLFPAITSTSAWDLVTFPNNQLGAYLLLGKIYKVSRILYNKIIKENPGSYAQRHPALVLHKWVVNIWKSLINTTTLCTDLYALKNASRWV